ncbi:MAG: hypothetical protein OK456_01715 [Thaumarchaeota archaeon]|nr:hypothetical protein [Nitrososphaerota archaeon]
MEEFEVTLRAMEEPLRLREDGEVFRLIFELNKKIGRAAAEHRELKAELVELQAKVNGITVSLKRGEASKARDAMDQSSRQVRGLAQRLTPQNNL